ncbi:MAG: PH domain-containing protein [Acidimicrobiia bacterium]|nr:PH domain-containing protein [Acidimicrobiia bacterium]
MSYPDRLLYEGEEVVLDLRPHWVALLVPGLWTLLIVALLVLCAWWLDVTSVLFLVILGAGLIAFVFLAGYRWLRWLTTEFVLTTERVISRHGIYAKTSKDIPLERINDVTFTQSVLERLLRSGSLVIRSASEDGENEFHFIRDPESVHNEVYRRMELQSRRDRMMLPPEQHHAPPPQTPAPEPSTPQHTIPEQIAKLATLRDQGILSEDEFQAKKQELLGRM